MNIEWKMDVAPFLSYLELKGKELELASRQVFHKAVKDVFKETVRRTPVGNPALWQHPDNVNPTYEPGTLRASWTLDWPDQSTAILSNPIVYAERVENGWSAKQAPEGMLRISLISFEPQIKFHAEEELRAQYALAGRIGNMIEIDDRSEKGQEIDGAFA